MVLPFPSFSAYFYHSCRNSCCLLLHFLITFVQSSLLLPCLHYYSCFSFSHNSGLSSEFLPQPHNSVHSLSPLSVCKISSKLSAVLCWLGSPWYLSPVRPSSAFSCPFLRWKTAQVFKRDR